MSPIGPSGKSGGPAGVSSSTVIQTGSGSPVGAVTPTQTGSLYQDLTNGALFQAQAATNLDWVVIGGLVATVPGTAVGVVTSLDLTHTGHSSVFVLGGSNEYNSVYLGDQLTISGPGLDNGLGWISNGTDGQQIMHLQLGSTGQFDHQWIADGTYALPAPAGHAGDAPRLSQLSPKFTITSGALPTAALASGTAAQLSTTRDVESHTAVTFNPGVATTATCTVALSPDNTTFSTLCVITKPVGTVFDGEIEDVVVRVPAGWYIKLTVNAQATLGTTTYY